jgi:glycosyltransferase involved in cell wall biosynthesis
MKRLLVVSQRPFSYGGGGSVRWRFLQRELPRHGWHVGTVTARPNPTANEASTNPTEAALAAARARVMGAVGSATRPLYRPFGLQPEAFPLNFVWSATGRIPVRRAIERFRPDVVVATCPPQAALFAASGEASRAGLPFVAELRDLWAGNPYFDAGGSLLARLERGALESAHAVVTVSEGCLATLLRLHPDLGETALVLPNGFDPGLLERRGPPPVRNGARATLIHAGTLYGDRSAVSLLGALAREELRDRVRVKLVGHLDAATEAFLAAAPGVEVETVPPVSWERAVALTQEADVAVVINSPATGGAMALPGKLYEALALGRPVLALTPPGSDTELLLRRLGQDTGLARLDDEDGIAAAVTRLLDAPPPPSEPGALESYDRARVAARMADLLDGLATTAPALRASRSSEA